MTMTSEQQAEFLSNLGLNPKAAKLTAKVDGPARAKATKAQDDIALAPEGMDPHTMDVSDIVFDDRLLEPYGDLTGDLMAAASRDVFARYKSVGRNHDRNKLLHRRISEWIGQVKRERRTGGMVREKVKTTAEERDIAQVLAAAGLTANDLAALIASTRKKEGDQ